MTCETSGRYCTLSPVGENALSRRFGRSEGNGTSQLLIDSCSIRLEKACENGIDLAVVVLDAIVLRRFRLDGVQ